MVCGISPEPTVLLLTVMIGVDTFTFCDVTVGRKLGMSAVTVVSPVVRGSNSSDRELWPTPKSIVTGEPVRVEVTNCPTVGTLLVKVAVTGVPPGRIFCNSDKPVLEPPVST